MMRFTLSAFFILTTALAASAQPKPLAETFAEVLPGLAKADPGAQQKWQDLCFALGAPDKEKARAEACKLMIAKLDAMTPKATRLWLLQQLQRIGGEESVDAISAILTDKDDEVRDAAVRALANNPSTAATEKLTAALPKASAKAKIGLLNALGHRGDDKTDIQVNRAAVKAIKQELLGADETVAIAAARALGRIPSTGAFSALNSFDGDKKGPVLHAVQEAFLAHADRYLKNPEDPSDIRAAIDIYEALNRPDNPKPIRLAALRGIIQTSGDEAGKLVLEVLEKGEPSAKAVAIGQIEYLTADALKTLAASLDKLPVPSRVAVIAAIAARGDKTQMPVALAAAKSIDPDVKRAGVLALGRLGDPTVVEFLLDVMSGKDATAGVAAESLASLPADGVNEKLIKVLEAEKTPARSIALIGILERRKATGAVPALLKLAGGTDAGARTAAFAGLKSLASAEHIPGMVAVLLKTEKGKEREAAEIAIVAVAFQIPQPEKRAAAILAKIEDESFSDYLPLLGRFGNSKLLPLFRHEMTLIELKGRGNPRRDAAVAGLCNWPDASANDDLLALADKGKDANERWLAVQALTRINTMRVDRTPEERLAALVVMKKTMALAASDDERRAILDEVGFVRHIETLRFVVPYLDQPAFAQSACKGVVELAHSKMLREPNKAEFDKALDRVIVLCKDKGLVDRAKQYKEGR